MRVGMIGLGRMGACRAERLVTQGHECVVYDRDANRVLSAMRRAFGDTGRAAEA